MYVYVNVYRVNLNNDVILTMIFHGVYRPLSKFDLLGAELAAPLTGALGADKPELPAASPSFTVLSCLPDGMITGLAVG
jgi:hypothetical protein